MRDSFIFYKSFYEGIKDLSTEEQAKVVLSILKYQFEEDFEEELTGVPKCIFALIKPQLDANNTRYENGCKGGAPRGNTNAKKKNNQKTTEKQPNENENNNEKDKKEYIEKLKYNFGLIWEEYPRKDKVNDAFKHYKAWIEGRKDITFGKHKLTNEEILEAVMNYNRYLKENNVERQYIKMGSTFFNKGLLDYLPKEGDNI